MTAAFTLTGYDIQPVAGMYALIPNHPQIHNAVFTPATSGTTLAAGEAVVLDTASTNELAPVVQEWSTGKGVFGIVAYDARTSSYAAGDKIALAQSGDIVYMTVGASPIAVGAQVEYTASGCGTVSGTSAAAIGTAVTYGPANGLVQVQLSF
jgi:hypothetical protein